MAAESQSAVTASEERIFFALGYLVVRWNYAEYFVRQLLRRDAATASMLDPASIKISNAVPLNLSAALNELASKWVRNEGEPYIKCLSETFAVALDHRNHLVHGVQMTIFGGDPETAWAVMIPSKIRDSRLELPSHLPVEDFERIANYFHDLAILARKVALGFTADGARALDGQGEYVVSDLPELIEALQPLGRLFFKN